MNLNETLKAIESLLVEQDIDTYECFECISGTIIYSIQLDGNSVIRLETCNEDNMPLTDEKLAIGIYEFLRHKFNKVHLHELSENQVKKLCKQISFGSLYYDDYNNSFGVDSHEVANHVDTFIEDIEMLIEDNEIEFCDFYEWFNHSTLDEIAERFYNSIQNVEYCY